MKEKEIESPKCTWRGREENGKGREENGKGKEKERT